MPPRAGVGVITSLRRISLASQHNAARYSSGASGRNRSIAGSRRRRYSPVATVRENVCNNSEKRKKTRFLKSKKPVKYVVLNTAGSCRLISSARVRTAAKQLHVAAAVYRRDRQTNGHTPLAYRPLSTSSTLEITDCPIVTSFQSNPIQCE